MNIGPLQNNGGPTPTDGLLAGSVAVAAGNVTLAQNAGLMADQRGDPRFDANGNVDVGAFELILPAITNLNPTSADEGTSFELTITGSGFQSDSTVTFGLDTLTPDSVSSTQITAPVWPRRCLGYRRRRRRYGERRCLHPGRSGIAGNENSSPPATFTINGPAMVPVTNPGTQTNNENAVVSLTITSTDSYAGSFTAMGLPPGLSISSTGKITGTIGAYDGDNSPYTVTVYATDDGTTGSTTFTWDVVKTTPPSVTNPGTQTATTGTGPITPVQVVSSHATSFTDNGTLPPGLSIDNSGLITGTPLTSDASSYNVFLTATRGRSHYHHGQFHV